MCGHTIPFSWEVSTIEVDGSAGIDKRFRPRSGSHGYDQQPMLTGSPPQVDPRVALISPVGRRSGLAYSASRIQFHCVVGVFWCEAARFRCELRSVWLFVSVWTIISAEVYFGPLLQFKHVCQPSQWLSLSRPVLARSGPLYDRLNSTALRWHNRPE